VLETIIIVILSLIPSLLSLLILQKAKQRWQARLRRIRVITRDWHRLQLDPAPEYEGLDSHDDNSFIGDTNCHFNAHSPYVRCAVNPEGPCKDCPHYEIIGNRE
jgi:Family of unknown function (DUF6464)